MAYLRPWRAYVLVCFIKWRVSRASRNRVRVFHKMSCLKLLNYFLGVFDHGALVNCRLWMWSDVHAFFISNAFISNVRLKFAKNQAYAKQHPRLNFYYLKIIQILHWRYHPKIIGHILKKKQKNKYVCAH